MHEAVREAGDVTVAGMREGGPGQSDENGCQRGNARNKGH
jgi:hypothetical protein